MGEKWSAHRVEAGKLKDRYRLEDTDMDGKIILKWVWKKEDDGLGWINLARKRDKLLALWKSNELSGFEKYGEYFE